MENPNGILPRFKTGTNVTYRDANQNPGSRYRHGGLNQNGFVGVVIEIEHFDNNDNCWVIRVSTRNGGSLHMAESDFEEYEKLKPKLNPFFIMLIKRKEYKIKNGTTRWRKKKK